MNFGQNLPVRCASATCQINMSSSENFEVWNGLELNWSEAFPRALTLEAALTASTATADSGGHLIRHFHK